MHLEHLEHLDRCPAITLASGFQPLLRAGMLAAAVLLAACSGGGGEGAQAPPLPSDLADLTQNRLLSDAELTTSAKASSWEPDSATRQWLQANHTKLRSLVVDTDFSDLEPLRAQLAGRRLVLLGESSHGSREFNLAKVRLIKFMHQQLGYGVLAFESSLIGCALQDRQLQARLPSAATSTCLFPVWRTEELTELMRYIASTQTLPNPLRLAGFDWQNSSAFDDEAGVRAWLGEVFASTGDAALVASDSMLKLALQTAQDGRFCRSTGAAADCSNFDLNRNAVDAALLRTEAAMLKQAQAPGLSAVQRRERSLAALALMSLRDRVLASQIGRGIPLSNFQDREPFMAKAITRLAREVYPQDKLMIWAHNAHIAAQSTGYPDSGPPMGSFLRAEWGTQMYGLGLFMLRGESALNDRAPARVIALPAASLEAHVASLGLAAVLLPVPSSDQAGLGDDWLHQPLQQLDWGFRVRTERLDWNYDGVLVIDRSSLPRYSP